MGRLSRVVSCAAGTTGPEREVGVNVALTYEGLKAMGLPQACLDSFAWEFRQGMAARAQALGDVGASDPSHWEKPLGTGDVHVIIVGLASDAERLASAMAQAQGEFEALPGVTVIWQQEFVGPEDEREHFGFRDGICHPSIEGSGV